MASIFILDDDRDITFVTETWLSRKGHSIQHFFSSSCLLQAISEYKPDILLLDHLINEQNMNGLQLCRSLKETLNYMGKVFIFTAFSVKESDLAMSRADGIITKPFDLNVLAETLSGVLK